MRGELREARARLDQALASTTGSGPEETRESLENGVEILIRHYEGGRSLSWAVPDKGETAEVGCVVCPQRNSRGPAEYSDHTGRFQFRFR